MEFDWDDGNEPKVQRHGVSASEAEQVFTDPHRRLFVSPGDHAERRWVVVGVTEAGRLLGVVFTRRGTLTRVITAREPSAREGNSYRRRRIK